MAFDVQALNTLLARMKPTETVRGFVFNAMINHVADKKGAVVGSGVMERVLKRRPNDLLSYPAADYFRLLHACAVALESPLDQAVRDLGYACALGFFVSPMGKLLLGIVGSGQPGRLMSNCPTAYATSFSFGERKYVRVSDRELRLEHQGDFLPVVYNIGAMHGALDAAKAPAKVEAVDLAQDAATYVITW